MRIKCPYCGERSNEEFTILGEAGNIRPDFDSAEPDDWHAYVYGRKNPKGRLFEYWQHTGGCRSWLVVERHTVSHEVFTVTAACELSLSAAERRSK